MHRGTAILPPELTVKCLGNIDSIVTEYVEFLKRRSPTAVALLSHDDLRGYVAESLEIILRYCSRIPLVGRQGETARRLGVLLAQRSVPPDVAMLMLRLNEHVLWKSVFAHGDVDSNDDFGQYAITIWQACERHTLAVEHYFLGERARLNDDDDGTRTSVLRVLLATDGQVHSVVRQAATTLGAEPDGSWLIAVGEYREESPFATDIRDLASRGLRAQVLDIEGSPTLVARVGTPSALPADLFRGTRCGYSLAEGLREFPAAFRLARMVASSLPTSVTSGHDRRSAWLYMLASQLGAAGQLQASALLHNLLDSGPEPRDRLLETLQVYFEVGSLRATAEKLYCHRNTVVNRLNQVHQLTGFDPSTPVGAAALVVMLACTGSSSGPSYNELASPQW